MKRVYYLTTVTCLAMLSVFILLFRFLNLSGEKDHMKVGFVYDNDESTAYTYNFSLAKDALERKYGENVEILTCSNVLDDEMEEPLRELAEAGCDVIFLSSYSDTVIKLAPEYPNTQFCQASYMDMNGVTVPANYHSFKGESYQGRYVSGIVAGMKLQQMISEETITEDQAIVGFVAAFPTSEVISGYTAFILGVRSVVPSATMQVCYTGTWSSYALEKSAALQLIDNGCKIISQHADTIGTAIACEESVADKEVYFVGWGQSMSEVAPRTSLVTARICWEPYVLAATEAVRLNKNIESMVSGRVHGQDASAGFDQGWIEMIDLNQQVMAPGTQEAMDSVIEQFSKGRSNFVYSGNYIGVNPDNSSDTIDLKEGFVENENSSYPTFNYVLTDVIKIVDIK